MKEFLSFSMFFGVLVVAGCSKALHSGGSREAPVKDIRISPMVATHVNEFAFNFLHAIQKGQPEDQNFFVSPLSVHMDLGMVLNGAVGTTYEEMLNTLDLEGSDIEQVNVAYKTLLEDLPVADPKVQLGLYNSVWYKRTIPFKADYISGLEKNFEAAVRPLDFINGDEQYVNQWASEKTNGKITKVLEGINPDDVMYLLNALYFKGKWSSQFKKDDTRQTDFQPETGNSYPVAMMYQQADFEIYTGKDYMALRLPYGNGQFGMTVILPNEGVKLDQVLSGIDGAGWGTLQADLNKEAVHVGLPRFTIPAYEISLNPILKNMGIKTAFDKINANFSKMAELTGGNLYVSSVKQNTYLKVDEEGTEAAAVTTTTIGTTSVKIPREFICDHPFGIIISEKTSNTILFMGKIMDPLSE